MKTWISEEKSDDKIVGYLNDTIYRVNPKAKEIAGVAYDFTMNIAPTKHFTAVPMYYVKQIDQEEGMNYLVVHFGSGSYEHLRIKDPAIRNEVFNYFKDNLPNVTFQVDKHSKSSAGKKPLIAMCIVLAIFLWTLYVSIGMEAGNTYEASGGHYNSIAGIVLLFASMGTKNVIMIFGSLLGIALFSYIKKIRNPKVVNQLLINR